MKFHRGIIKTVVSGLCTYINGVSVTFDECLADYVLSCEIGGLIYCHELLLFIFLFIVCTRLAKVMQENKEESS